MRKTAAARGIAWVLVLACFLLFCTYAHASFAAGDHECRGISCSLCLCNQLKAVAGTFLAAVAVACLYDLSRFFQSRVFTALRSVGAGESLVQQKVKLSN